MREFPLEKERKKFDGDKCKGEVLTFNEVVFITKGQNRNVCIVRIKGKCVSRS